MAILGRLNKLEQLTKPLLDEVERQKIEVKRKEESFKFMNQVMEECYPDHGWCKFSRKERMRIFNKPTPRGIIKHTDSLFPRHIPSKKREDILYFEANRLVGDVVKAEILRRRKLTRGKTYNK